MARGPTKFPTDEICQCPISHHIEWFGGRQVHVLDEPVPALGDTCAKCGKPHLVDLYPDD